jgi:hypothetical protein
LSVYRHLLEINAGFDQVVQGLAALRKNPHFQKRELARYEALAKEARATTNSYILGALEHAETAEAGRRFGRRWERERREEKEITEKP